MIVVDRMLAESLVVQLAPLVFPMETSRVQITAPHPIFDVSKVVDRVLSVVDDLPLLVCCV